MRSGLWRVILLFLAICMTAGVLDHSTAKADNTIILSALGTPYLQNFDSLSNTTDSDSLPVGWVISESGSNANNRYLASTGNSGIGNTYSFGSTGSTDRALGGIQDSNLVPTFGASFTNHTGGVIQSVTIKYTGEEWRLARTSRVDKIIFELSTNATTLGDGSWTDYEELTFFTPFKDSVGAKDGNLQRNRLDKQFTVTGMSIAPGETFWIRWRDYNDTQGLNDGLAVDDFSLIPNGVDNTPTLVTNTPADSSNNVLLDANLSFTFSEPVNLSAGWLSLSCSISKQHTFSVSGGPMTFSVDPDMDFINGDICSITIFSEYVSDQDDADPPDRLDKDYSLSFSALPLPDDAPIISNLSPANNAISVSLDSLLSVQFSEPVAVTPGWFLISCTSSGLHMADVSGGSETFTLTPQNHFHYDENCTLTIIAQKVSDLDLDDPPDNMPSDFSVAFSTLTNPDTAPFLQSSIPSNDTDSVPLDQTIELTFNEPVAIDSRALTITCSSGEEYAFSISGGPSTFLVKPDHKFVYDDYCSMTITALYVTDLDLTDPPDAMLLDQIISFKTVENRDAAPTVTKILPADGANNVAVDSDIRVEFSEDIWVDTSWAELKCSLSGEHTFVTSGTSQTKVIKPDVNFANNESCLLTLFASQIHDQDSKDPPDEMDDNFSISFSTTPPTDQPPSVVEVFPPNNATDVAVDNRFNITFSEPVNLQTGWVDVSCIKGGVYSFQTEGGPIKFTISTNLDFKYADTCTGNIKAEKINDLDEADPPDLMSKDYSFTFSTRMSPDSFAAPTVVNDETLTPHDNQTLDESLNHLFVQFSKDVLHDGTDDAANNTRNYRLLEWGANHTFDTSSCETTKADDKLVTINSIQYDSASFTADLSINYGVNLPKGTYRLIICGAHTIRDLAGTPLNDGADSVITFSLSTTDDPDEPDSDGNILGNGSNTSPTTNVNFTSGVPLIPVTGFRQGIITKLEPQQIAYTHLGEEWLDVPALALETAIIGVPKENDNWDVTWLGSQIGWLEGSAQLGHKGNSVLTAHVWDALNKPGPFYGLEKLKYGDQVILHAWGQEYVYEVREVFSVKPENVKAMLKHQEKAWLTLVTCQGYDEDSGAYQRRVLVRAVLMEVK